MAKSDKTKRIEEFGICARKMTELAVQAAEWEANEFLASNTRLYGILQSCYAIFKEISGSTHKINELDRYLLKSGIKFQSNTGVPGKIIKLVFNIDRRRASVYAKVLHVASVEDVKVDDLPDWIAKMGGVEEVRRSQKSTVTESPKEKRYRRIGYAKTELEKMKAITSVKVPSLDYDADQRFVLLFGVAKPDGSIDVIDTIPDDTTGLRDEALARFGRSLEDAYAKAALEAAERELRAEADAATEEVAAEIEAELSNSKLKKAA